MLNPEKILPGSILEVRGLQTWFDTPGGIVKSVAGVDFSIRKGETLALVGESGSGKSVTSLSIMRLIASPPGRIAGGSILFRDRKDQVLDLAKVPLAEMRRLRGAEIAMIFQEPMTSLNPVFTIGDQIAESIMLHEGKGHAEALVAARRMLELVEIPAADRRLHDYPHQLSGGMRQRVMIALALACSPALLIADEPTTALDVTIQAQILDLMRRLQREIGMSMLFITHNLGVVAEIAHEVAVMYAGRIVERASVQDLFAHPHHPYTSGLLTCMPRLDQPVPPSVDGKRPRLPSIPGTIPHPAHLPPGCAFSPRCALAIDACSTAEPDLRTLGGHHLARCIRAEEMAA
jgi:oligopeptide/dipeptide ABC transporter ATP-binding protein